MVARIAHWNKPYRPKRSEHYDSAISQTWRLCDAGAIDRPEAEARDIALRELRYALAEGREACP